MFIYFDALQLANSVGQIWVLIAIRTITGASMDRADQSCGPGTRGSQEVSHILQRVPLGIAGERVPVLLTCLVQIPACSKAVKETTPMAR